MYARGYLMQLFVLDCSRSPDSLRAGKHLVRHVHIQGSEACTFGIGIVAFETKSSARKKWTKADFSGSMYVNTMPRA